MSKPIISTRGLEKEFLLCHSGIASLKTLFAWSARRSLEHLKVLQGLDLDIHRGECVAIVGRNGAGKSTLLSILSRVYKPTRGTFEVNGKIAPLLELGAGFHLDLTGIENIIFNGVILGLSRKQVLSRLDEVIEFAELRHHIDAPVRTYSSGMMARLGFSIAVHVDADILIVDEVLAVGDYAFEKKCYEKIAQFKADKGTILFVSHNLEAVKKVADRCVWLKDGRIHLDTDPEQVIQEYQANQAN